MWRRGQSWTGQIDCGYSSVGGTRGECSLLKEMSAEGSHLRDEVHEVLEGRLASERVVQDLLEHSKRVDVVQNRLTGDSVAGLPVKFKRLASSLL